MLTTPSSHNGAHILCRSAVLPAFLTRLRATFLNPRAFVHLVSVSLLAATSSPSVRAADATWSLGTGGGNWNNDAAWTPASAPGLTGGNTTSTDTATLDTSTRTINSTVAVDSGRNIGNIIFNSTNAFGYTLNGGSLVLTAGGTVLTTGIAGGQSNITTAMTLQGNYTFTANSNLQFNSPAATFTAAAGLGAVTMNIGGNYGSNPNPAVLSTGVISEGAGSTLSIVKTGSGSWQFNGANTFTGGIAVKEGFFGVGNSGALGTGTLTLGDSGGASNAAAGFGSNVNPTNPIHVAAGSSGTLSLTRTGGSGPSTLSGPITLANNLTISQSAANAQNFNISSNMTGAGDVTVKALQGTGTTTLSGSINMTGQLVNSGVSASPTVVSGVIGSNVTGVTQNSPVSQLTLSNTNSYSGGTNVNRGTLLLSGALNLPAAGVLQVNAGGRFSLADGTARTTTTASLGLADGASLAFDWNAGAVDMLTSTAAATTAGNIGIIINNTNPTDSGGILINSPAGGLTTANSTRYFLANNTNFTAALTVLDTDVSIGAQSAVAAPTLLFWQGNKVLGTGTAGVDNALALSSGTASNWSIAADTYTVTGVVPGSTADVIFSSSTAPEQQSSVLGADMTLKSVTFNDATAVTIGGNNSLTLISTVATAGTGTAGGGSAITVTPASADPLISANVILGANQVWNVAAGKTLTVSGSVLGTGSLTKADAGTVELSGVNAYTGATTVQAGVLNLTGNRTGTAGSITVGNLASTTGTLGIANGSFSVGSGIITVGSGNATTAGIINQTGGTLSTAGNVLFGNGGTGTLAGSNSSGTYNLSAGSLIQTAGTFALGTNTGGTGIFNLSGTGAFSTTSTLEIARSSSASATTNTTGTFAQTGGTATVGTLSLGGSNAANHAGGNATLTISGGTFTASSFSNLSGGNSSISTITIGGTGDVTLPAFPVTRGTGAAAIIKFDGGTLRPQSASAAYMGNLTSAFVLAGGAKLDVAAGKDITVTQPLLTDPVSTGGGFTKAGAGILTLAGANTYTGHTTVSAGTLLISSAGSLDSNSTVAVNAGTLGGAGTVNGPVSVASGAVLQAGMTILDSATFNLTHELNLAIGSILSLGLGAGGEHDTLNLTGGLVTFDPAQSFRFLDQGASPGLYANIITGLGSAPVIDGWTVANDGWTGTFSLSGNNVDFTLTAVPEPGTWALLGLGLAALLRRRRSLR